LTAPSDEGRLEEAARPCTLCQPTPPKKPEAEAGRGVGEACEVAHARGCSRGTHISSTSSGVLNAAAHSSAA